MGRSDGLWVGYMETWVGLMVEIYDIVGISGTKWARWKVGISSEVHTSVHLCYLSLFASSYEHV